MYRTIVQTPVSDILRNAAHSVDLGDVDWFSILAAKVSHDHFDWLADEIMANGFTVPIVIADNGPEDWTIGNGHHRLCAAILLGLDTVPVIFESVFGWVDDSHDGDHELPPGSYDYWTMLRENVEGIHYGDENAKAWRYQYNRQNGDDDDTGSCDYCGGCVTCCGGQCQGVECDYCPAVITNGEGYSAHHMGCPERDYEAVNCPGCSVHFAGQLVWRFNACPKMLEREYDAAKVEHVRRGYLLPGAWHPVAVLAEAYAEQDERIREAQRFAAQRDWQHAMAELRDAAARGLGDYGLCAYAERAAEAMRAYEAL